MTTMRALVHFVGLSGLAHRACRGHWPDWRFTVYGAGDRPCFDCARCR